MLPVIRTHAALAPFAAGPINRLDTFFDRVFGEDGLLNQAWSAVPVSMWEDEDHVFVEADLPGVAEGDVDITVHNGMLFLRGERKPQEGRRYACNSRAFGRFERVLGLPEAVDTEAVRARLADGVLTITLPKSPQARPRKISIQTS